MLNRSRSRVELRARLSDIARDVLPPVVSRWVAGRVIAPWRRRRGDRRSSSGRRIISTIEELDEQIARADAAAAVSDDELRKVLFSFEFVAPARMPADPFSIEYADAQMALYRAVSGRAKYDPIHNEATPFDMPAAQREPFPFGTHSASTVGEQLMMIGFALQKMALKPFASVLEFGPGWGTSTVFMAQMGYNVTAVDVHQPFLDLVAWRAKSLGVNVELQRADMLEFVPARRFDAVFFFECFHHCADHLAMLRRLHDMIGDDGVVVFAGEPITALPYPWGLRLDGMSAWSVRKFGWLELGFTPDYFRAALARTGWTCEFHPSRDVPHHTLVIARPR